MIGWLVCMMLWCVFMGIGGYLGFIEKDWGKGEKFSFAAVVCALVSLIFIAIEA